MGGKEGQQKITQEEIDKLINDARKIDPFRINEQSNQEEEKQWQQFQAAKLERKQKQQAGDSNKPWWDELEDLGSINKNDKKPNKDENGVEGDEEQDDESDIEDYADAEAEFI